MITTEEDAIMVAQSLMDYLVRSGEDKDFPCLVDDLSDFIRKGDDGKEGKL